MKYNLILNNDKTWTLSINDSIVLSNQIKLWSRPDLVKIFMSNGYGEQPIIIDGKSLICPCQSNDANKDAFEVFKKLIENKFKP